MTNREKKSYTVKELAELSGVSVRTLHFYDQIGLVKPAYYGENGYRYYERAQLLHLQQVLFYRELGFELAVVQKILSEPNFDKLKTLRAHREMLKSEAVRTQELLRTIEKTIAHFEEQEPITDKEIYMGFDAKKQAAYEAELIEKYGDGVRAEIQESQRRTRNWQKSDYEQVQKDYDELHQAFTDALTRGLSPEESEVQKLVRRHYNLVDRFWTPDRQKYIGLGRSYCEHPDFRKLYESYHPALAEYLAQAMKVFAERELT